MNSTMLLNDGSENDVKLHFNTIENIEKLKLPTQIYSNVPNNLMSVELDIKYFTDVYYNLTTEEEQQIESNNSEIFELQRQKSTIMKKRDEISKIAHDISNNFDDYKLEDSIIKLTDELERDELEKRSEELIQLNSKYKSNKLTNLVKNAKTLDDITDNELIKEILTEHITHTYNDKLEDDLEEIEIQGIEDLELVSSIKKAAKEQKFKSIEMMEDNLKSYEEGITIIMETTKKYNYSVNINQKNNEIDQLKRQYNLLVQQLILMKEEIEELNSQIKKIKYKNVAIQENNKNISMIDKEKLHKILTLLSMPVVSDTYDYEYHYNNAVLLDNLIDFGAPASHGNPVYDYIKTCKELGRPLEGKSRELLNEFYRAQFTYGLGNEVDSMHPKVKNRLKEESKITTIDLFYDKLYCSNYIMRWDREYPVFEMVPMQWEGFYKLMTNNGDLNNIEHFKEALINHNPIIRNFIGAFHYTSLQEEPPHGIKLTKKDDINLQFKDYEKVHFMMCKKDKTSIKNISDELVLSLYNSIMEHHEILYQTYLKEGYSRNVFNINFYIHDVMKVGVNDSLFVKKIHDKQYRVWDVPKMYFGYFEYDKTSRKNSRIDDMFNVNKLMVREPYSMPHMLDIMDDLPLGNQLMDRKYLVTDSYDSVEFAQSAYGEDYDKFSFGFRVKRNHDFHTKDKNKPIKKSMNQNSITPDDLTHSKINISLAIPTGRNNLVHNEYHSNMLNYVLNTDEVGVEEIVKNSRLSKEAYSYLINYPRHPIHRELKIGALWEKYPKDTHPPFSMGTLFHTKKIKQELDIIKEVIVDHNKSTS